ncbi:MAG: tetratricopeptide repeat protein, partial [Anaerolineaceae bacterium]|nr:tetratricopeptide repeat protein [Anaerolineaceae bacterium]
MSREPGGEALKAIHELLLASFDAEGLERFCCFRDPFAPVVHEFAPRDGLAARVDRLLVFCQKRGLLDRLLADLARERPDLSERIDKLTRRVPVRAAGPGELPAVSRLPFDRNALFTGRVEVLETLARGLLAGDGTAAVVTQAVHGMGGVGKTQAAVEFAYRYGHQFRGVHWLNAREPAGIAAEIAACGERMGLQPWPAEQPEQVAATLAAWRDGGPRLVVLDNLEDMGAAREWLLRLRQESGARVLLTARRGDWPPDLGLSLLPLAVFSAGESLAFLRRYLPAERSSDGELGALAERLGRLPLALELAGRYLAGHRRLTVGDYLARLERALDDPSMQAWKAEMGNPTGHDLDLMATFAASWAVDEIGPAARRAFRAASWCAANETIPCTLLERAAGLETEACDEALSQLVGLGLLAWPAGEAGPAIHPLLGEFGQAMDRLQPEGEGVLGGVAEALARLTFDANETGLPGRFAPLRAHAEAVAPAVEGARPEVASTLWNNLGFHLRMIADLAASRSALERALAIDEQAYGPEHPEVAIRVNNLGSVLRALGDLAGARAAFERALAIDEEAYGPDHPNVAIHVNNLG